MCCLGLPGRNVAVVEATQANSIPRRFGGFLSAHRPSRLGAVFDRLAILLLLAVTLVAVFVPWIAPHSSTLPIGLPNLAPGHGGALLGTDEVGRDILSRVLYGLRASWLAALGVIASGVLIGGLVGLIAGTAGGWLDAVLMRITDGFLALPGPILAIAVVTALGPSFFHTLLAVAIVWWPYYARIVRGEIRGLAARPHFEAARLAGATKIRLATRHLFPGSISTILVTASNDVGALILTLAGLSFIGLGSPAPAPELGSMAAQGLIFLLAYWWIPIMPALAVFALALVANLAGDGVRDLLAQD